MSAPRLTKRILDAMGTAISAMLAGMEGEGDWPDDLPRRDLEDAESWVGAQLARRERDAETRREDRQAADEEATYRLWNPDP